MIFTASQQSNYSVLDLGFDKSLTKALLGLQGEITPELVNVFSGGTTPRTLIAGELLVALEQQTGVIFSGKTSFSDTTAGYRMGIDSDDEFKFIIGTTGQQIDWNVTTANTLTIDGSLAVNSLDIGGSDATSWHVDTDGNMWWGTSGTYAGATIRISAAGSVDFTTGNFSGTLSAASGTLGSITIGTNAWHVDSSGNMWWGTSATYAGATIKISSAGSVDFTTGNFSGTLASGISITSPVVTGGTVTGSTIQTNSGANTGIKINSSTNDITIFDGTQKVGTIYGSASSLWLQANVAGGNVSFANGATLLATITQDGYMGLVPSGAKFLVQAGGAYSFLTNNVEFTSPSSGVVNLNGNLTLSGTVDGIDISSHAADASAHHSSTSSGLNIVPLTCVASGTGTGASSALKAPSMCTTSGLIYFGADLVFDMYASETRTPKNFVAATAGSQNLGSAGQYWNDVSYKTLTDRGCLGWFDEGVELQDGTIVSDIEALKFIKKHPTLNTIYGKPRLDYKTMPKAVYKKAEIDGKILDRDKNDNPYFIDEKTKEKRFAEDGAETTALISIMLGAIKELNNRLEKLEK